MEPPVIDSAGEERRAAIVNLVTLGFASDPMVRWMWPSASDYLTWMPQFIEAFGGRGFEHGSVYEAQGGRAAAMWLPPETGADDDAIGLIIANSIPVERMEEIGAFGAKMGEYHPGEPHWYLPLMAADPMHLGCGLGGALLKHALAKVDEAGLPAYLESSNPRNISLYERHGFEVMGEIQSGTSPIMRPMYRQPRAG